MAKLLLRHSLPIRDVERTGRDDRVLLAFSVNTVGFGSTETTRS